MKTVFLKIWRNKCNEFTVESEEVIQQLNSLNIHEAAGPDSPHPMIIKTLAENENFVNAVTVLFHAVASTCCSPNPWKRAIVTALHKKGPLNDAWILLAFYVKYLRNYFTDISTPTYVTTSARTNMALFKASRVFLTFWKQCIRSIPF